jgi:hypothetical protein
MILTLSRCAEEKLRTAPKLTARDSRSRSRPRRFSLATDYSMAMDPRADTLTL